MTDSIDALVEPVEPVPHVQPREPLRRRLFVGTAYAFVATVLGQAFGLITSIIYARLLGTHDLGILAIYAQIMSLAVSIGSLGLRTPITKFVAQLRMESPAKLEKLLATVAMLVLIATIAMSAGLLLLALGGGFGAYRSPELMFMIELAAMVLVLNSLTEVGAAVLQGLQRIRFLSLIGIASEGLAIPVMFASLTLFGLVGAAVGGVALISVSASLTFGSAWRSLRKEGIRIHLSLDREAARSVAAFSLPLIGSALVVKVALLLQSSFIALDLGYDDTGLFRVASTIARVVAFVPSALAIPLLPAITELYTVATPDRARKSLTAILRVTTYVGFPFAATVALLAHPIIVVLYGGGYRNATALAFVLVMAGFVEIVDAVAANALIGEGRTRTLLVLDIGQSILIVAATVAFVRWVGLLGVGYAALLTAVAYLAAILVLLGRSRRIHLRQASLPLGFTGCGFALITVAVVTANAFTNYGLGGILILVSFGATWAALGRTERRLLLGLLRDVLHLQRGPR